MALDWKSGGLAAGLACYRNQEFFEAHEHWEDVWNELVDSEKAFLQGLIQVTVAMHHYQRANFLGAERQLRRALVRLERCPACFGGIDVARLSGDVREWLRALEKAEGFSAGFPRIEAMARSTEE
jgi:uncharacterized protein